MKPKTLFLMVAFALAVSDGAIAGQLLGPVVAVHYSVRENDPEKLQKSVTEPVERLMRKLEHVSHINSSTSHGVVDVEIGFQIEATALELAAVTAQVDMLKLDDAALVVSRTVEIRPPRLSFDDVPEHR